MAHMLEQRQLPIQNLYAPELLSIIVGANSREFKVPRGLICSLSKYFETAFGKRWAEGKSGSLELQDVEEWIFECFVGWLYTNRLLREPSSPATEQRPVVKIQAEAIVIDSDEQKTADAATNSPDPQNAVTWKWRDLIDLYVFADRYDTKDLRRAAMEAIQIKLLQTEPTGYALPSFEDLAAAFANLSGTAPLYGFLLELATYEYEPVFPTSIAELEKLPHATLATLTLRSMRIADANACSTCRKDIRKGEEKCTMQSHVDVRNRFGSKHHRRDVCSFHEHETEESRRLCEERWRYLNNKHDFDWEIGR